MMRLFAPKERGPKVRMVHVGGGFYPLIPEKAMVRVREVALEQLLKTDPSFAELWKRGKNRPMDWSTAIDINADHTMDGLKFNMSMSLSFAAGVGMDALSHSADRYFVTDGHAELPNGTPFMWCIGFYFDVED